MMQKTTYILTGSELCAAAQAAGLDHLLLPQDPYRGYLVEEIEEETWRATRTLNEKGLLHSNGESSPVVDAGLIKALLTLARPDRSLLCSRSLAKEGPSSLFLHRNDGQWSALTAESGGQYCLESPLQTESLVTQVINFTGIGNEPAAGCEEVTLPDETWRQARQMAQKDGAEAGVAFLFKSGVKKDCAQALAEALAAPVMEGSLAALLWDLQQAKPLNGTAYLLGGQGLWLLEGEKGSSTRVSLKPINSEDLKSRLQSVVESVL